MLRVQKIYRYHSQKSTNIFQTILKVHKNLKISFSKVHKKHLSYPKSAQKFINILKSAQESSNYPKSAQKSIDIILKSAQKPSKIS